MKKEVINKTLKNNNEHYKELLKKRIIQKQIKEKIVEKESKKFILLHVFWVFLVVILAWIWSIYAVYLSDLPDIKTLWNDILPETSVIYDKNWGELYKLFSKEKRTYVDYNSISQQMKNAITSTEDKTFFENSGFDFKWLVRAGLNYVTWKSDKIQWTSTISQQLIKVSFLTNERSVKRKIQEFYLSYKMNSSYSKEKILELYLNKISFGSNAYWIEEAAKTFFGKSVKDVWILESSILASIPKGPTYYSPYNHKDRLMGYTYAYQKDSPKDVIKVEETENPSFYNPLKNKLKSIFQSFKITKINNQVQVCNLDKTFFKKEIKIDNKWCYSTEADKLLDLLNGIRISYSDLNLEKPNEDLTPFVLEYNIWRKDFVLGRMLDDNKIKPEEYTKSIVDGLEFKFKKYTENIKYPHFVFFVKEYLEDNYGKDFGMQEWLKIYTTLDPKLQDKAEELVKKQVEINKTKYWASNAALISIDNPTGQILAMVGWSNYFEDKKWSNVNIITSLRQPWSSFKPIVYTNAIATKPISPETPIYDSETKFWWWNPDNYDRKFMWLMPLRKALDYSRNIPAIKVFVYWWWEDVIVKFANSLGINSIKTWAWYWMPLAIWTWELKPLELAQAYSVFANMWVRRDITPILRIEDKKWNIIDKFRKKETSVVSAAASYIISKILSDASSRPNQYWNNVLTLKDRKVAAKTGTSNKDVSKWWKKQILPWDLWTAWYTPQITTVVWAGNTDWSATKWTCDWLNCAAPIWHDYMEFAHIWLEKLDFKEPEWVIHATISKYSWKLASNKTPSSVKVSSIFAIKPNEFDWGWKELRIDTLCNWIATDSTPEDAIKIIYQWWSFAPIIDSTNKAWLKTVWKYSVLWWTWSWDLANFKNTPCERPNKDSAWMSISTNLDNWWSVKANKIPIDIRFDANNPVIKIILSRNWKTLKTYPVKEEKWWNISDVIDLTWLTGKQDVIIKVIDKYYYTSSASYKLYIWWKTEEDDINTSSWEQDNNDLINSIDSSSDSSTWTWSESGVGNSSNVSKPVISMKNPSWWDSTLSVYEDQFVNIRWSTSNSSAINVYINWSLSKILDWWTSFAIPINEWKDLKPWTYSVKIEAINANWESTFKIVEVNVLKR